MPSKDINFFAKILYPGHEPCQHQISFLVYPPNSHRLGQPDFLGLPLYRMSVLFVTVDKASSHTGHLRARLKTHILEKIQQQCIQCDFVWML